MRASFGNGYRIADGPRRDIIFDNIEHNLIAWQHKFRRPCEERGLRAGIAPEIHRTVPAEMGIFTGFGVQSSCL